MQRERPNRSPKLSLTRLVRLGWVGFCLLFVAACHMDMYNQARYEPYEESSFFRDGAASRPLEPGVVARLQGGTAQANGPSSAETTGRNGTEYVAQNPIQVNEAVLKNGEARYNIFCLPCHGATANGRGVTYRYFNPPPASMYLDRIITAPDGYLYDVITNGKGQMFSYASRIPVEDRWAIIAYIRQLQQNPPASIKPEDRVETTPTPAPTEQGAQPGTAQPTPTP